VAAAAPASELARLLELDLPTLAGKGLGSMALASWAKVFPDAELEKIVEPQSIEAVEGIAKGCIGTDLEKLVLGPDAVYLQEAGFLRHDPTTTEPWASIISNNSATAADAGAPLFIAQGTADVIVHPEVTESFAAAACDAGIDVELKMLEGVDHGDAGFDSAGAAADWIAGRFADRPAPSTCADR
jgi:acetyl esterase/lipase